MNRPHQQPNCHRRGFTLVEMLIASALSAVLLMGIMSVAVAVGSPKSDPTRRDSQGGRSIENLVRLLERDLAHAQTVRAGEGKLVLTGYGALDPMMVTATHIPAAIVYALHQVEGRKLLIRSQYHLSAAAPWEESRLLVSAEVTRFSVVPADRSADEPPVNEVVEAAAAAEDARPVSEPTMARTPTISRESQPGLPVNDGAIAVPFDPTDSVYGQKLADQPDPTAGAGRGIRRYNLTIAAKTWIAPREEPDGAHREAETVVRRLLVVP